MSEDMSKATAAERAKPAANDYERAMLVCEKFHPGRARECFGCINLAHEIAAALAERGERERERCAKPAASDFDVAKSVYRTIELFGWSILWRSQYPIPDDAWPIDIIAAALAERGRVERERAAKIADDIFQEWDDTSWGAERAANAIRNQSDDKR